MKKPLRIEKMPPLETDIEMETEEVVRMEYYMAQELADLSSKIKRLLSERLEKSKKVERELKRANLICHKNECKTRETQLAEKKGEDRRET